MTAAPLRVLIVDDEALARGRVRALLAEVGGAEVVGECRDGAEAVEAIGRLRPDLVLLDIQMPGLDGFGVIREVGAERMPAVVFVTAFDEHALRAFEVHAVDYLLKPFDAARLRSALDAVRRRAGDAGDAGVSARLERVMEALGARGPLRPEHLLVRAEGRLIVVPIAEIDWVEAAGKYVRLHVGKAAHLSRQAMREVEEQLDPARFVRVHRSAIVRVGAVRELQPVFNGDWVVILRDGTEVTMSRTYRAQVQARLGGPAGETGSE